eukprot:3691068-Pleurochrysis_carterae.AAC.2
MARSQLALLGLIAALDMLCVANTLAAAFVDLSATASNASSSHVRLPPCARSEAENVALRGEPHSHCPSAPICGSSQQ